MTDISVPPPELLESYLFANTPAYLFRAMTQNKYLEQLKRLPSESLRALIDQIGEIPATISQVVNGYCALVALCLQPATPLEEKSAAVRASKLPWASALFSLAQSRLSVSTNFSTLPIPTVKQTPERNVAAPSKATTTVRIPL